ncbi:T9SS type A sorting domain-containing protein [Aquimarina rhabdastrellae]
MNPILVNVNISASAYVKQYCTNRLLMQSLILICIFFTQWGYTQSSVCDECIGKSDDYILDDAGGFIITCGMLDKKINEITWPSSHNAYANDNDAFIPFSTCIEQNQDFSIKDQLRNGIRVLELDPHSSNVYRHGYGAGMASWDDVHDDMLDALKKNPFMILIIKATDVRVANFWEDKEDVYGDWLHEFAGSDGHRIGDYNYNWPKYKKFDYNKRDNWPTLRQMIESNNRVYIMGPGISNYTLMSETESRSTFETKNLKDGRDVRKPWKRAFFAKDDGCPAIDEGETRYSNSGYRVYQAAKSMESRMKFEYQKLSTSNKRGVFPVVNALDVDYYQKPGLIVNNSSLSRQLNIVNVANRLNYERNGWDFTKVGRHYWSKRPVNLPNKLLTAEYKTNSKTTYKKLLDDDVSTWTSESESKWKFKEPTVVRGFAVAGYGSHTVIGDNDVYGSNDGRNWNRLTYSRETKYYNDYRTTWWVYSIENQDAYKYIRFNFDSSDDYSELAVFEENPRTFINTKNLKNVALLGNASQSSTHSGVKAIADRANDGDTYASSNGRSFSETDPENKAWWMIDLKSIKQISHVSIYKQESKLRNGNYKVVVSEQPLSNDYNQVIDDTNNIVIDGYIDSWGRNILEVPVNARGRYVRIYRTDHGRLNLGEVKVWSRENIESKKNIAIQDKESVVQSKVTFYPNPVTDYLRIESVVPIKEINIITKRGRIIAQAKEQYQKVIDMNVSDLKSGLYMLKVTLENEEVYFEKIVKN